MPNPTTIVTTDATFHHGDNVSSGARCGPAIAISFRDPALSGSAKWSVHRRDQT